MKAILLTRAGSVEERHSEMMSLPRIAYWYVSIIIIINIFMGYAVIMSR